MKHDRHKKIIELISEQSIETQEELLELLKFAGFEATQATVSRDIKELQLIKKSDASGNYRYATTKNAGAMDPSNNKDIFVRAVISIDYAMNNVVIKCYTGMAQAACAVLDAMSFSEIVGTLAGDDTIFVVSRDEAAAQRIYNDLKALL